MNTLFTDSLNRKQSDCLCNVSLNNFPTPTPLLLDNIPNRLSLINSVYCDEDNITTEDENTCTAITKTSSVTITSTRSTISTVTMNNIISNRVNATINDSGNILMTKISHYSHNQNSDFNQLPNDCNHNRLNQTLLLSNNLSKYIPLQHHPTSQFMQRYTSSFSPTISLGSIESPNLSVPSSDLYNHSYGDDVIIQNSENNDSSFRDNESLFVRINKQVKVNPRNIDYTKQTVTAL
ncbi:metabotropic glutamate receptor 3 (mglur group 2) [Schistosoma japonicum]|uniref:Metabotropic glutamate receptor 3 (Mglur group 2) n=1 Tax=Schistosoma japonicum TaxID=6182 RepID=A0A4Z2DER6_SCHJA|nr:metabotropic glutamate receptor 3 (mglur group 2) [Schistosoma japonicum]